MAYKVWIHGMSFNLSREIGRRLAVSLTLSLLLGAEAQVSHAAANSQFVSAPEQDQNHIAAQRKFEEGEALRAQGTAESLRLAMKKYEEALPLWRAIGARREEAVTLNNIGAVYNSLGEWRKALDFLTQALPLLRAVGDRREEATTLTNIGSVYDSLGEKQKALEFFTQSLPPLRAIGDRGEEATTLNNIGAGYDSLGEKQKALEFYGQALPLQRAIGDRGGEAASLNNIGAVYNSLGEKQKALEFYTQALTLQRAIGDRSGEATTLNSLGATYDSLGEWQKALEFYSQALPLRRAVGDRRGEAITINNIGLVYDSLGEKLKALDFYTQALPLGREAGDRRVEATTLNNLGLVYDSLGEKQKALDFYTQALPLSRAVSDRVGEARTLNNLGLVYDSLGEKQKALDFYTQALPLLRAVGDRNGESTTLSNLGAVYDSLGEWQKALDFYSQSLPLSRAVGSRSGESRTLNNMGLVYDSLGEKQKALEFFTQALPLLRAVGDRSVEATTLSNLGAVYDSLGEKQKALDFYTRALPLRRAVGDRSGEATTLNNIGLVYVSLGDRQKALELFTQALPLGQAVGAGRVEAATLGNIAYVKRALGRFDEARSHMESALKIIESIRAGVISKELRASYFATAQGYYEFYVDLLMEMRKREPTMGHDATALQANERARARSLIESLTEARADIRKGIDPALLARERELQQRLNTNAEARLKLLNSPHTESQAAAIETEANTLTIELQQVQTQIRQTSPRYADLTQPKPLALAEIQQQVLDADTLLLQYSLGTERGFLWAVTPTAIASYELPKREVIEAAAKNVYDMLAESKRGAPAATEKRQEPRQVEAGERFSTAAAELSRMLLAPVAQQLGKRRLAIVADGALHYLPFGALPDPNGLDGNAGDWKPLIVEHEIVNLPSATTLAVLRRELKERKPAPKTLAVLADPVFMADDERFKARTNRTAPGPDESIAGLNRQRILNQLAQSKAGLKIARLPFTRQEGEQIMALVPAGAGMKALDFEASRATATSDQLSQYRYVHFATHGLADSERPELSTIVLSLFDEQGRPQDGFLRAHEVYNLNLPAEMVTLSACETGLGKLTRGEGLVSLTRGFMYAGAARVVVSLWSVSDRATAELMAKFYRRVLVEGERPAAALRAAQVEMWRDKRWEAPYYWAAFTLQGEWR
jgi:CHAT domain-containing protein/tetratricopeptide (TPR) repeat protein